MLKLFLARLREPSTMAGIAAIAVVVGASSETAAAVSQAVAGAAGLAAVLLPEGR